MNNWVVYDVWWSRMCEMMDMWHVAYVWWTCGMFTKLLPIHLFHSYLLLRDILVFAKKQCGCHRTCIGKPIFPCFTCIGWLIFSLNDIAFVSTYIMPWLTTKLLHSSNPPQLIPYILILIVSLLFPFVILVLSFMNLVVLLPCVMFYWSLNPLSFSLLCVSFSFFTRVLSFMSLLVLLACVMCY
jgi:hypothetical protein